MKIESSKKIIISEKEIKEYITKGLYEYQGISGISDIQFVIDRKFIASNNPNSSDYIFTLEAAEVKID